MIRESRPEKELSGENRQPAKPFLGLAVCESCIESMKETIEIGGVEN